MHSQFKQDIWVMQQYDKPGFFVDIGAADGVEFSNSLLLEENGWQGICVEPHPVSYQLCKQSRKCIVENACVYNEKTTVQFRIADAATWSGIENNFHDNMTRNSIGTLYLETKTLTEILDQYNAPSHIEYISIDTEGTELQVLQGLDFNKYSIDNFTIEHNAVEFKARAIYELLHKLGYQLVIPDNVFEHWYTKG